MSKKMGRLAVAVSALALCAAAGWAQAPSAEDEARNLLKAMNVEAQYKQMQGVVVQQIKPALQGVSRNLPEAKRAAFLEKAEALVAAIAAGEPKELMEESVKVYAKHYSLDELKGLKDFYATPLGKKLLAETPGITSEMMTATMRWNQSIADRLLGELIKEFPELNAPAPAAAAPAGEHQHQ